MSSVFLDKYASELRKGVLGTDRMELEVVSPDPLERYKEALANNHRFEVTFGMVTASGTLYGRDEFGVTIILEGEDLARDLSYYSDANKSKFIGVDFVVKVASVDDERGIVYVRSAWSNAKDTRNKIIAEIFKELAKGKSDLVLPGRVMMVNERRALVDLLGKGILGIINVKDWECGYVRHLNQFVKKNDILDFVVQSPLPEKKNFTRGFRLTRVPLTSDPWKNIPVGLEVGAAITVKCIDKPAGKSYWWGTTPFIEGIEVMGDYTTSIRRPLVGISYKCKITKLDAEKHKLQVAPFDIAASDTGTREAVKFIVSKRPAVETTLSAEIAKKEKRRQELKKQAKTVNTEKNDAAEHTEDVDSKKEQKKSIKDKV